MNYFIKFSLFFFFIPATTIAQEVDLSAAIDNNFRKNQHKLRDAHRNPLETLNFFGIQDNFTVLEILPGKGYYSEILSNYLNKNGDFIVANFGSDHPNKYLKNLHDNYVNYFKDNENFGNITITEFKENNYLEQIKDNSLDMILTFRNSHNWLYNNQIENIYSSFNKKLKKNGILGVVQHRANTHNPNKKNGYIEENFLINLIESNNFELLNKSSINNNPKDTKDYPKGVWTLPPTLRLGEENKENYIEIGESDRMTLKFKKL